MSSQYDSNNTVGLPIFGSQSSPFRSCARPSAKWIENPGVVMKGKGWHQGFLLGLADGFAVEGLGAWRSGFAVCATVQALGVQGFEAAGYWCLGFICAYGLCFLRSGLWQVLIWQSYSRGQYVLSRVPKQGPLILYHRRSESLSELDGMGVHAKDTC